MLQKIGLQKILKLEDIIELIKNPYFDDWYIKANALVNHLDKNINNYEFNPTFVKDFQKYEWIPTILKPPSFIFEWKGDTKPKKHSSAQNTRPLILACAVSAGS